jgi:hypothetical protein
MTTIRTIHVGWMLTIDDSVKEKLVPVLGGDLTKKLMTNPIVAVLYGTGDMDAWFSARKDQPPETVYIRGIYKDAKDRYVVAHVTFQSLHQWCILYKATDISAMNLRARVSKGEFGKEIPIERITTTCKAYRFQTCPHRIRGEFKCRACESFLKQSKEK